MKLHLGSFAFGCGLVACAAALAPRLRPILVDLATAGYRSAERLAARASIAREDVEDILAEAKARARAPAAQLSFGQDG